MQLNSKKKNIQIKRLAHETTTLEKKQRGLLKSKKNITTEYFEGRTIRMLTKGRARIELDP